MSDRNKDYLAHISDDGRQQTVAEHLSAVSLYAAQKLESIGLPSAGALVGLVHDMGKLTHLFTDYISAAHAGESVRRGSVNHTFAAVIFLWERFHSGESDTRVLCEMLCCAVGAHHGLFDCLSPDGKSGFMHRLASQRASFQYDSALKEFLADCATVEEIERLFANALGEFSVVNDRLKEISGKRSAEYNFYLFALTRLITSALIDADRADTMKFMCGKSTSTVNLSDIAASAADCLERRLALFNSDSEIKRARRMISDKCLSFHATPARVLRLNVPTGAGKTLAALRFAITRALSREREIKHIFYVAPLLTVLEQNADEIRASIGNPEWVLEHHSSVIKDDFNEDELSKYELLAEDWSAPVIVTTLVQLLNTMFKSKTNSIRRMHTLCNSIVIIDEVQSIPYNMLSVFNGMINFLAEICGSTVVLCSATQPVLDDKNIKMKLMLSQDSEMVPYDKLLFMPFRRSEVHDLRIKGGFSSDELAKIAAAKAEKFGSALVILNTRKQAADVFNELRLGDVEGMSVYHLSASMCQAHRRETLGLIRSALDSEKPIICISTQLIEAGVDISFGCVIRSLAGIDSIAQAAGRCNRHGELCIDGAVAMGEVDIISSRDENTDFLKDIRFAQLACEALLNDFAKAPEKYDKNVLGDRAVDAYYRQLFKMLNDDVYGKTEYPIAQLGGVTLYSLLTSNSALASKADESMLANQFMRQSFKTAGDSFSVFDDESISLIVPYNEEARMLIKQLYTLSAYPSFSKLKELIDKLKPYTVSVYSGVFKRLDSVGAIISCFDGRVFVLAEGYYDSEIGINASAVGGQAVIL